MTCLLLFFYIPTKYYQSMSKGIKVMEHARMRLQYFCFRGDNYITNKVGVVSCTGHAYWSSSSSLPNIIKLSQTVWELWPAQDFGFRGDNLHNKEVRLSILHATRLLVLLYIPTKYYQNMSKGYGAHNDASMDGRTDGRTPCCEPIGRGIKR